MIKSIWQGNKTFTAQSKFGHDIISDAPAASGGDDNGPSPVELMLSGLAGCTGIDVTNIMKERLADVTKFEITVDDEREDTTSRAVKNVTLTFDVEGEVDLKKLKRAISLSVEKYCTVAHSLKASIDPKLFYNGTEEEL
ncbi:OsmC family protein [Mammaliicoccus lentus]|uniref:OsmC family protein n=1 Tax=Mammaliicoccus TaxID=2803850 RepID=UPI0002E4CF83|nr:MULTISPECIES: OsmC family protein [Mammaliicoccus]MBF0748584.1 OsmC family protein [Mammaliicoccus lentus]MBW0761965.1 OsmC family protein [Mammaliicoccus lentus]MBW0769306.1 OsmC family protein [Mammaliicoccus lentus]MDQ7141631.1 OsmC family protein [Mammaliicoccus lentus]TFU59087.1 OsmC family peroxiredoxin [Mammaliicoccus lentus]